jgi:hypothetical protein
VQRGRHDTHLACVRPCWRVTVVNFTRFRMLEDALT